MKSLVFTILLASCSAYGADVPLGASLYARCAGMSDVLGLPDNKVFIVLMKDVAIKAKNKYGNNSEQHVQVLVTSAMALGYGMGYMNSSAMEQDKDAARKSFMTFCWNNDDVARDRAIAIMMK